MDEQIPRLRIVLTTLLAVALLAGLGLTVVRMPRPDGQVVIIQPTPPAATAVPAPKEIKVYVSGAVARAGVYTMREDQRIEEALVAAGGAQAGADLSRLNLAARVRDEMQIHVTLPGEAGAPAPAAAAPADPRVDINTATLALLDTLPDIGPATGQKIIAYRERNGPFKRLEELTETKLISASTLAKIKDLIVIR